MQLIVFLLVNTIAVFIAGYVLPGVHVDSAITAFIVAIVLGVINTFIRPVLLLLTLPITLITLGLFTIVINGLLVLLVTMFVSGFTVDNFWWAMGFSIVVSLISWFLSKKLPLLHKIQPSFFIKRSCDFSLEFNKKYFTCS